MTLEYSLDENDYLQHQLFTASKTERIKKQRKKSWIWVALTLFCLSLLFLKNDNTFLVYYFLGFGCLSLLFYPLYQRKYYKNHYQKYVRETYKNRFGEVSTIKFNEDSIEAISTDSESKINYTALEEINEIGNYFFLKLKSGGSLLIPKLKIANVTQVKEDIKKIAEKYNLKENVELNWTWK